MRSLLVVAVVSLASASAFAQTSEDKATADALFDEGKKLMKDGKTVEACDRFEASVRTLPQLGVRMNLANCYEQIGRTASAWAEWREAASLADKTGDNRAQYARDHAAALEPKLVKLTIKIDPTDAGLDGLAIRRDGNVVATGLSGVAVPLDPGKHTVEVSAPGKQTWKQTIDLSTTQELDVPVLAKGSSPPTIALGKPARGQRIAAYAVGGAGIVGLAVSGALAAAANGKWKSAISNGDCDAQGYCSTTGLDENASARGLGNAATIAFAVGAVAVAAGAVLYLTTPRRRVEPSVSIVPSGAGLAVAGSF
jgi:serine/threonine-protein kinase